MVQFTGGYMRRSALFLALVAVGFGFIGEQAAAAKSKAGHKFKGSIQTQYRSNSNVSIAASSNGGFDFADPGEFGDDEEDQPDDDSEDEEDDSFDDDFADIDDAEYDEDEIEEDDAIDEDGDGIDDLIDPNADIRVDKESRFSAKFALTHKYTFENEEWSWNNGVRFSSDTHQQRDDLDKFNYAFTTGGEYAPKGSPHKFKSAISYVTLDKDNNKFVSTFIVSFGYSLELSKRLSLGAAYNYQDKNITNPDAPDATVDTLAFSADFKASANDIFKLKIAPKFEDSTKVTRDTDAWGYELTYTRKLPWDMTAGLGYRFDNIEYQNLTPRREDTNRTWAVELSKDFNKHFGVNLGYETRDRQSNIPGKDAENDSTYFSAEYKF